MKRFSEFLSGALLLLAIYSLCVVTPAYTLAQVVEPKQPPKKVVIVPPTLTAKGGELLVIDASKATGDVQFAYDQKTFTPKQAIVCGKTLILSIPKCDDAKTHSVTVISFADKSVDYVAINVPGEKVTPPPTPIDSNKVILDRLDKIESRLAALEQIKPIPPPPVPSDPFTAVLQAAYEKDGKPASALASLTAVYRQSPSTVNNTSLVKASDLLTAMHSAAQSLIQNQLPTVRRAIADDSNAAIGSTDGPLDAAWRARIATQFLKVQHALEGVK
jgi:hypothetical protein